MFSISNLLDGKSFGNHITIIVSGFRCILIESRLDEQFHITRAVLHPNVILITILRIVKQHNNGILEEPLLIIIQS